MIGSKRILASIGASGPARASSRARPAAPHRAEWFTIGEVPREAAAFRTAGDRAGWLRDASRRLGLAASSADARDEASSLGEFGYQAVIDASTARSVRRPKPR
jgi:hypothetical protein